MKNTDVPFISNTPDDLHCLPAAYMSIAMHFDKNFSIPMNEWSTLVGYEEGKGTWANAGLVWFKNHGYDVKHIEEFDFESFIKTPKDYMIRLNGETAGVWGYEHTNVPAEIKRMEALLNANIVEKREPTIDDIKHFINEGFLVRVTVNSYRLNNEDGYDGHAVVITDINDSDIQFHDPGLPAIANRRMPVKNFETAWSDQARELDAIRKQA